MEKGLTHFDQEGNAVMVDVSGKISTYRTAVGTGYISCLSGCHGMRYRGKCQKRRCSWSGKGGRHHGGKKHLN